MEPAGTALGASRSSPVLCDRYRLTRRIGRGGSADVFAAVDDFLHRPVAVKLFRSDVPAGGGMRRVEAEMRMLARLRHPGLVTVFDAGLAADDADGTCIDTHGAEPPPATASSGTPFLVMELIEGVSLRQRLGQGPLTGPEAAELGRALADTLAYVHASGVVHRDVKPANILIDSRATAARHAAKLADFGIARLTDATHMTADGTTLGTANYLSPEQVLGTDVGPPADVYALGLVVLECLTGEVTFEGSGIEAALARLRRSPAVPHYLHPGWRELLVAMTERDPARRPSAQQVALRLEEAVASGEAPTPSGADAAAGQVDDRDGAVTDFFLGLGPDALRFAVDTGPIRPTRTPASRRGLRWVAGAALALAAVVLTIVLVARANGSRTTPTSKRPTYPGVSGAPGQHLRQLERSIG